MAGLGAGVGTAGRLGRLWSCRQGSVITGYALSAPLFLLIVFGILDVGRLLYASYTLDNATRQAARVAAVNGADSGSPITDAEVETLVRQKALFLRPDEVAVTVSFAPDNRPGSAVTIETAYLFNYLLLPIAPGGIDLGSTASMTITR
jgi:Flp pilus assembly protein TadG